MTPTLIGPPGKVMRAIDGMRFADKAIKLMLYGPPGIGKTTIADSLAAAIGGKWDTESINGRNVTIEVVREWQQTMHTTSMFGDWKVRIINEADVMSRPAQDLMLTLLDELPPKRAIICTSNLDLEAMTPRFRTRFITRKVEAPTEAEIASLLVERGLPHDQAAVISVTACGNVRAALNDADAWLSEKQYEGANAAQQLVSFELLGL